MYKGFQQEVRILCKQDSKEERPQIFIDNELFILPIMVDLSFVRAMDTLTFQT